MNDNKQIKLNDQDFFKKTVTKMQNELSKFITNTNYSDPFSIYLRQELKTFQKKLNHQSKHHQQQSDNEGKKSTNALFPQINHMKSQSQFGKLYSPEQIYTIKGFPKKNYDTVKNPKLNEGISFNLRSIQDELKTKPGLKVIISRRTFIDSNQSKIQLLKYSNEKKNNTLFSEIKYDNNANPIISEKDMKKGLLNMIYKGIIPKIADLTPAFETNGASMLVNNNIKDVYRKINQRDEIVQEKPLMKYNIEDYLNDNSTIKSNSSPQLPPSKLFITNSIMRSPDKSRHKPLLKEIRPQLGVQFDNNSNTNSNNSYTINATTSFNINNNNQEEEKNKLESNYTKQNILQQSNQSSLKPIGSSNILTFADYLIVPNNIYSQFNKKCVTYWSQICYLINNLSALFKKLKLTLIHVDCGKLLSLAKTKIHMIQNKDLLNCIAKDDLIAKGFDPLNSKAFYNNIREVFVIKIQSFIRKALARINYKFMKQNIAKICLIQSCYRNSIIKKHIRKEIEKVKESKREEWNELMAYFKDEWNTMNDSYRIEIHINSLSFSNNKSITIDHFKEKENSQLNRLIRLIDPNVEMVYISPYPIDEEILEYYFSILANIGVVNIRDRFHLIVPDLCGSFPPYYSLSHLLYFSTKTIKHIKLLTKNKYAYIVPGQVSRYDEEIALFLNIPILMGSISEINLIFNKSGVKSLFEINEIAFPISAWDIKTEEEFYSSLAHLIASYLTINIWIFKINTETNGRGIAYVQLNKYNEIKQLKQERENDPNMSLELLQEKAFYILQATMKSNAHIAIETLYPTWNDYLRAFISEKGIIESCPTFDLNGIMGSPAIPIFIEPTGRVQILPTFDKLNTNYFRNYGCTSPQQSLLDIDVNSIGEKLGEFLYKQDIIGYVTIEFITFHDGKRILYWGIDLKFGFSNLIASVQWAYFLYIQAIIDYKLKNEVTDDNKLTDAFLDPSKLIDNAIAFVIPGITDKKIAYLKMKDFLTTYRYENLVFDLEKREGVIFNFFDTLECGSFGLCGIILKENNKKNEELKVWKTLEKCTKIIKDLTKTIRLKPIDNGRNDILEYKDVYSKIKTVLKQKIKELEPKKINIDLIK